jgi:hypothetical protein
LKDQGRDIDSGGPFYSRSAPAGRSFGQAPGLFEKPDVPVTIVTDSRIQGSWRAARHYIQRHFQGKPFVNRDTGWTITVGKRGRDKLTSKKDGIHYDSVVALPDLIERAVLAESQPDRELDANIRAVHRFYAPIEVRGTVYRAKLTVFETIEGDRLYDENLTEIEKPAITSPRLDHEGSVGQRAPSGLSLSIADLLAGAVRDSDGQPFAPGDADARYSRQQAARAEETDPSPGDDDVTVALKLLARNDELFQLPRSDRKPLGQIAKDVTEQLKRMASDIPPDMTVQDLGRYLSSEDEWAGWWQIKMPDGLTADVYQSKDGYLHINAADLRSGQSRGSALYHLVATFAFNNGLVFRADPLGLSEDAQIRRTENMLSSALKFGTTRHLEPDPSQGVAWKKGDDGFNFASLARKSVENTRKVFPQIDDIEYNFETRRFESDYTDAETGSKTKDEYDRASFQVAAYSAGGARKARAGGATLARAAFINTLLRRSGQDGWDGVLAQLAGERGLRGLLRQEPLLPEAHRVTGVSTATTQRHRCSSSSCRSSVMSTNMPTGYASPSRHLPMRMVQKSLSIL